MREVWWGAFQATPSLSSVFMGLVSLHNDYLVQLLTLPTQTNDSPSKASRLSEPS